MSERLGLDEAERVVVWPSHGPAAALWWADALAALIVGIIVLREGWSSLSLAATRRFGH